MRYRGPDRYQFQPWPVRLARWLRHRPWSLAEFAGDVARWAAQGLPVWDTLEHEGLALRPGSRLGTLGLLWGLNRSRAAERMGHYSTLAEVMARIRARAAPERAGQPPRLAVRAEGVAQDRE